MSFNFNFGDSIKISDANECVSSPTETDIKAHEAKFHPINKKHVKRAKNEYVSDIPIGTCTLKCIAIQNVEDQLKNSKSEIISAITSLNDLIPNVYEGGLKIWECSLDLAEFLQTSNIIFKELRVLELGCGAGIPALVAFVSGSSVCFQDFNPEVLDYLTIPNVLLNTEMESQDYEGRCTFVSGDWAAVKEALTSIPKFDLIVSSETIYNKNSQMKLLNIMKSKLKTTGAIYLAAKTCYFGVGGTLRQFEELVIQDGTFAFNTVWKTEEGVQREILHLWFKNKR